MKKISLMLIIIALLVATVSCDESSGDDSGSSSNVSIPDQIEEFAEEFNPNPSEAEVEDTTVTVDGKDVTGTENTDLGVTGESDIDVSVTLPDSLASRADFSSVAIQLWLNGIYSDIANPTGAQTVTTTVELNIGRNVFCFIMTKNGVQYRTIYYHIYRYHVDSGLIAQWIKTDDDFDTGGENDGYEITSDGKIYEIKKSNGVWNRGILVAENLVAQDGNITSYNQLYMSADLYVSTYSLSENDTRITIIESSSTFYGVKNE
jgi:hypothetical protein